ncbi:LOW QUALITY PROTEIN: avidin-like [Geothlypis trichas]
MGSPHCDLQGKWRNELGSNMSILAMNRAGTFSGCCHTAVAAANKQILLSSFGVQQHPSAKGHPDFSFTVQWQLSATACQLSGLWRNDQDSLMEISVLRDNGDFHGQYLTRVTLSGGCAQVSPLRGAQQQPGGEGWPTFAFTVRWDKFSNATTAFVGQCFVDAGGKEMLSTMWLLREAVGSLEEDWKATRVGRNVFTRKRTTKGKILPNLSLPCEAVSSPGP